MGHFLIIDPDEEVCNGISAYLAGGGHHSVHVHNLPSAARLIGETPFDVIISDIQPPGGTIRDLLEAVEELSAGSVVVVNTGADSLLEGMQAVKAGAFDVIQRPFTPPELEFHVRRAIERRKRRLHPHGPPAGFAPLIGASPGFREAIRVARLAAPTGAGVLLTGEAGTGKALLAAAIHCNSGRALGPFVHVHCAAFPAPLLERELFGREPGPGGGSGRVRIGRLEQAGGGTLYLDEVGALPPAAQARLLRALQEREFERPGGNGTIRVDVRVISSSAAGLESRLEEGRFRHDLYYRLNVIPIRLPPLRERGGDLERLARAFLQRHASRLNRAASGIGPQAAQALRRHPWPGNVGELERCMERAVRSTEGKTVTPRALGLPPLPGGGWRLEDVERRLIGQALERSDGRRPQAAGLLGLSTRALGCRLRRLGLTRPG